MSFGTMLYSFFLLPIQLVFEVVFSYAYRITDKSPGLAIIALSLAINLLVLPLYRRADAIQEEERSIEARLHAGVSHIKKTFSGDERTMMLQTYYRQNNYSPLYVLRSSVSLFLEIPFFIAAYHFLSELSILRGTSFGPISDLGLPDGLITIGSLSINILPIIMTIINVISTVIFTKGYPLKTKIQLYGMALLFLVLLYNSPSGLVFYWTLNNLFSLVKTIFYKINNPSRVIKLILLGIGVSLCVFSVVDFLRNSSAKRLVLFAFAGIVLCVPYLITVLKKKTGIKLPEVKSKPNKKLFWCEAVFMTVLTGLLIPSAVIGASPQEFVIIGSDLHPVWYIVGSTLIAAGTFILWFGVFYWLFSSKAKVVFERVLFAVCGVGVINYLFFGNGFGNISTELVYENGIKYDSKQLIINSIIIIAVAIILIIISRWKTKIATGIVLVASLTILSMSVVNIAGINTSLSALDMESISKASEQPKLTLSKTGKNVVVLMLDRAMGEYIPYIMSDYPELKEKYSGFTYYSNVISYGGSTNVGSPPLFGGYEYTPEEMNKRDNESLESKHNEALKVMPAIFDNAGYDVTVCDPPYAGYQEIPDLSIYNDYPDINTYITNGSFYDEELLSDRLSKIYPRFFSFSITKISPAGLQSTLYDKGNYHYSHRINSTPRFDTNYSVLKNLSAMTCFSDNSVGSFVMMDNETTHNPVTFDDPQFLHKAEKNDSYQDSSKTYNGITLKLQNYEQISAYETNIASLMRVGEWFDYLKKEGVYDNTRIIIVSDHGYMLEQIEELMITVSSDYCEDTERFFPLLMVKDFDSEDEFAISDEFMTNADVPSIATDAIIRDPVNPFTNKALNDKEKYSHNQFIMDTYWVIADNKGNTFLPGAWYSIHDSIWRKENWEYYGEKSILPE